MINGRTQLFGIIGDPVEHSLSPVMHNAAFQALGVNAVYVPMRPSDLEVGIGGLRALGFVGVSVTVPFKVAVMPLLDVIDPVARAIGAVNTLHFQQTPDGQIVCHGCNTDWLGANQALGEAVAPFGRTILLIGAGGAARAIGFGLRQAGAKILLTNRTETRGRQLAAELGATFIPTATVPEVRADALINTTSVGMQPHDETIPIDPDLLCRYGVVMDIVYAPLATRLLREAAARGCRTIDGLHMLLYQGVAQFRLWTGQEPPVEVMREALINELRSRGA